MKTTIAAFLFLLAPLALFADFTGRVTGVSDGDTITVLTPEKKEVKVRLAGVDCPEKGQPFAKRAKNFTSTMVFDRQVEVRGKETDKYGRFVGVVICGEKNLNFELLKAGLAWHYKHYSKSREFAKAEKEARENGTGLWKDQNPVAPWDYRREKTSSVTPESVAVFGGIPALVAAFLAFILARMRRARARRKSGPRMDLKKILKPGD